jgi:putative peptidoglycan lipid II flippase
LTLPAAVALAIAAEPILAVLFQRGAFGPEDTRATAGALAAYSVGLPAFVLIKVMAPAFFARQDTATPVRVAVVAMVVNAALTFALMVPLGVTGNALALSVAGWVNALALMVLLHRRGHFRFDARARRSLPRIALAALLMGIVLVFVERLLGPALATPGITRYAALAGLVSAGLATFGASALVLGAGSLDDLRRGLRRRAR